MAPVLRGLVHSGHGANLIVEPRRCRVAPLLARFVATLVPTVRGGRSRRPVVLTQHGKREWGLEFKVR